MWAKRESSSPEGRVNIEKGVWAAPSTPTQQLGSTLVSLLSPASRHESTIDLPRPSPKGSLQRRKAQDTVADHCTGKLKCIAIGIGSSLTPL